MSSIVVLALLQASGVPLSTGSPPPSEASAAAAQSALLPEEEFLLFAVNLDRLTLSDALSAYGDPNDPLLPIGELARLLDLDVTVSPAERRVVGTLGQDRRSIIIDLNVPVARVGGKNISLTAEDFGFSRSDIYIRSSVLGRILPLGVEVNAEGLAVELTALEKLPIQERMERIGRIASLGGSSGEVEPAVQIDAPYRLFSPPSFDVALETGTDTREPRFPRRYDVRAAGDLLYANFQGYLGSDQTGRPSTARILFERRSASGDLLGPLRVSRISAGDVYTPALSLGPRSGSGRGISFSTVPLEQASVFNTIDLRGELPIGFEVELYINDVLRSGQRTPVQGRYEFLNVPLVSGINVIRIVSYGARGERSEVVRVVNVGGGQLRKNETNFEFGLVQQDKVVIDPRPMAERELIVAGVGAPRLVGSVAHGLTSKITIVGGFGLYTNAQQQNRNILTVGVRTSISGFAVQADAAGDHKGGLALALGVAGQPLGISTVFRHSEYRGGFIDEANSSNDFMRPLARKTALTIDMSLPSIGGKTIPLSFGIIRGGYVDGHSDWTVSSRASTTLAGAFVSNALDYAREASLEGDAEQRLTGSFSASKFLDFKWQLRGNLDYEILPDARPRALSFTADRAISDRLAIRFGIGQTLTEPRDTFLQSGGTLRLPFGDLALTGDYAARTKDWRIGVRFAFGSLFDRGRGRYLITPPGPASGGNAILHAFFDKDGDGRFGTGDEAAPKVSVEGGEGPRVTGPAGRAVVTGLGSNPSGRLRVNIADIDELYVRSPPPNVSFAPRPGQVLQIPYPLAPVGEVYGQVQLRREGGLVGLSAVRLRLVRNGIDPVVAATEYDGTISFPEVPLGTYRLELDPGQAGRLGMSLKETPEITVTTEGAKDFLVEVIFSAPKGGE